MIENNLNSANGVRSDSNKPNGTKHKKTNSNLLKQKSMNQKVFNSFYQEHEHPSKKHSGENALKMHWDPVHSKSNKKTPALNLGSKLNSGIKSKKLKTPLTQSFTQNEQDILLLICLDLQFALRHLILVILIAKANSH